MGQSGFKKVQFPFVNTVKNLDLAEGKSEQLFVFYLDKNNTMNEMKQMWPLDIDILDIRYIKKK